MQAELDLVRHRGAKTRHPLEQPRTRLLRKWNRFGFLPVPDHHLVAEVPLDAKIAVRDMAAERRDLGQHGALVGRFDGVERIGNDHGADDRERRGQADLEADAGRQLAPLSRRAEVEIGRTCLAGITQLAEANRCRIGAFGQREQGEAVGRADRTRRVRPQQRVAAKHGVLPGDPHAPPADLAIRDSAQIRPEQLTDRAEHLFHGVEADAAHEVRRRGCRCLARHLARSPPV
jgi:hypothetical protein